MEFKSFAESVGPSLEFTRAIHRQAESAARVAAELDRSYRRSLDLRQHVEAAARMVSDSNKWAQAVQLAMEQSSTAQMTRSLAQQLEQQSRAAHLALLGPQDRLRQLAQSAWAATCASIEAVKIQEQHEALLAITSPQILIIDEVHPTSTEPKAFHIDGKVQIRITPEAEQHDVPASRPIQLPPAHGIASVFRHLLTKRAYHRIIIPQLVDMYDEYYEAIGERHRNEWRARWIVIRGYLLILWSLLKGPILALKGLLRMED